MNNCVKNQFLLPVLIANLAFMLADRVTAQTFTTLYSFSPISASGSTYGDNSDGADPNAGLVLSGNTFSRHCIVSPREFTMVFLPIPIAMAIRRFAG